MCINWWQQCKILSEKSAAANLELMGIQLSPLDPCGVICHAGHVCHGSLLGSQQSFPLALPQLAVQLLILCLHQLTFPFNLRQGNPTAQMSNLQGTLACSGGKTLEVCCKRVGKLLNIICKSNTACLRIALVAIQCQLGMLYRTGKYATDNMSLTTTC